MEIKIDIVFDRTVKAYPMNGFVNSLVKRERIIENE